MTYGTVNADLITTSDGVSSAGVYGLKNRLINGDMRIDQRNAGASITPTTGQFSVDRWNAYLTQSSKYTLQQNAASVTPPVGFTNYIGATSSSAYSITSTDYFLIRQSIEGLNTSDLAWGTANAATVTLSFWVRSSLTGTFGGSLTNNGSTRSYPFSYTINSANTWQKETITITGDTSGTWLTTNGIGINVFFSLGSGSTFSGASGSWSGSTFFSATGATSVVGTNGATFYVTGVQLEKGSTATSFDYLDYGRSLMQCQRYYYKISNHPIGGAYSGNYSWSNGVVSFPVTMRATPTLDSGAAFTVGSGSAGTVALTNTPTGVNSPSAVGLYNSAGNWTATVFITIAAGFSAEL